MNLLKIIVIALLVCSCSAKDSSVDIYKSQKVTQNKMTNSASSQPKPAFSWVTPKNWNESTGNSIRLASFSLPAKVGSAEVSLIILSGQAGGLVPNINRWRGQVGLDQATDVKIKSEVTSIKTKIGIFKYKFIKNNTNSKAIMAAILKKTTSTLFVKATGHLKDLAAQEKTFLKFIEGISEN